MRHIDKTNIAFKSRFEAIVDPCIQNGHYRYDDLADADRIALREVLRDEQDSTCAYCMRFLPDATSDHVIPKYISLGNYGRAYRHLGKNLYRGDFIYGETYTDKAVGFYYPHPLAYGNMVYACYDCNQAKDNDIIRPAFFKNPVTHVTYNDKGTAEFSPSDTFSKDLKTLINNDQYILIRFLWRAIKQSGLSVNDVENATDEGLRNIIFDTIKPIIDGNRTIKNFESLKSRFSVYTMWNRLKEFRWFWNYY